MSITRCTGKDETFRALIAAGRKLGDGLTAHRWNSSGPHNKSTM
ncbi:MAG: hypothetical protein R2912_06660 [Eubacteriales bacterium]